MVAMVVHGPLCEEDIGLFGAYHMCIRFIVLIVDDGVPVVLTRIGWSSPEDFASAFRFRDARGSGRRGPGSVI